MKIDRRSFLNAMIATGLTAVLDPEQLLWSPDHTKDFSFPTKTPYVVGVDMGRLPDGHYMTVLHDIKRGENGEASFIYHVAEGPYKGHRIDFSKYLVHPYIREQK